MTFNEKQGTTKRNASGNGNGVHVAAGQILIVDDMASIRRHLRDILESNGYTVVGEAEDGDQALGMVRKHKPDLVIMDIVMERMNGIDATRAIRSEFPSASIVMITQEAKPSVVLRSIQAGAKNFVIKPFREQQVLNVVRNALAQNAAQS